VLCSKLKRRTVGAAEHHRHLVLSARHVEHFRRGVDDFVDGQQREVPGHELDDRSKTDHCCSDADAGEPELGDRRIDDAHRAKFVEQSLRDLVGSVVLRDFLSHQEDTVVPLQLLAERLRQSVTIGDYRHQELVSA
jgi:hypothetical protein